MLEPVWNNDETSPFRGSRKKLERARKHLNELRALVEEYTNRKPYTVRLHQDVEGGETVVWLSVKEPVPVEEWGIIIGDVIHNLRSALDLLACSLVRLEDPVADCRQTSFPIFKTSDDFARNLQARIGGAHAEAIALIEGFKPYGGGTDLFYHISMLDNIDKHRLLIPTLAIPKDFHFEYQVIAEVQEGRIEIDYPIEIAFRDGAALLRLRPIDCTIHLLKDTDSNATLQTNFGETGVIDGEEVLSFLDGAVNLVSEVLKTFNQWGFWEYGFLSLRVLNPQAKKAKESGDVPPSL